MPLYLIYHLQLSWLRCMGIYLLILISSCKQIYNPGPSFTKADKLNPGLIEHIIIIICSINPGLSLSAFVKLGPGL